MKRTLSLGWDRSSIQTTAVVWTATLALLATPATVGPIERIEAIAPEKGKSELASTALDPAGGYAQSRTRTFRSPALAQVGDPALRRGEATFEGLGDLEGGDFDSAATDVSADGSVVAGFGHSENGTEAFLWEDGSMEGLGDLEGGSFQSIAIGVSADGSVVAGRSASETGIIAEAFRWEDGTMEGLGFLGGGFLSSQAFAVSADGTVVVGGSTSDSGEAFRRESGAMEGSSNEAFRWEGGAMEGLGDLEGGQFGSIANDVSADGAVVVGQGFSEPCELGNFCGEAFRWENGAMEGLGDLEGGDFFSTAFGVSADGTVVVGVASSENAAFEAFRWEDGVMQGLGDLPGGIFASLADGASADGSVIVGLGVSEEGQEAIIWTEEGGMRSLKEVIEDDFGLDLTGWTLSEAFAVSDDGTVFVGIGFNPDGNPEAWRAFLPPGNGGTAELVFDPTSFDFGDVEVGTTSEALFATLQNTGDLDATVLTFDLSDPVFEADTSACDGTLPAGGSCDVSVTFTPQISGPASATLHVDSDEGATVDLDLSGNGVGGGEPPVIDLDPNSLSSTLPPGGTETQDLTISNLGGEPLEWEVTEDGATGVRVAQSAGRSSPATVGAWEGRTSRSVVRVTEDGVFMAPDLFESGDDDATSFTREPVAGSAGVAHSPTQGATLWSFDDDVAIAGGIAIDDSTVWGAWLLNGSRLSAHSIAGDGTPDFELPATDPNALTGVASAKGADRILFVERDLFAGDAHRVHAFTSQSDGTPDWSFEPPFPTVPGAVTGFRQVAVSHDGSTAATTFRDNTAEESTLYVFDAETGEVTLTWTDPTFMPGVDLSDDGSIALVTQSNLATVLDTATGDVLFQTEGSGGGSIHYRISGDGNVLVVGGFDLDVYQFDGTTYQPVIEFTQPNSWFGQGSAVSRDGSTVGTFAGDIASGLLEGEVFLFDVTSGEMIGSHPVSGGGAFQGLPVDADSNDDGTVMAFASWGTQNQDWPEVMVFNRDVELIGAIEFPGSAFSVDITADGQHVVGGAKAVHANVDGNGGRIELIEVDAGAPGDCVLPTWVSVDPTSGTVLGGESLVVEVTFDSTGLESGTHEANLCLASNDPVTPLVVVPLTLTVEDVGEGPVADISPDSFEFEVPVGGSDTQTMNIGNVGDADLDWEIDETEGGGSAAARAGVPYDYGLAVTPEFYAPMGSNRASGVSRNLRSVPADPVVLPAPQQVAVGEFDEGFDDITMLPGAGWALINNSDPVGPSSWFQGNETIFESHAGDPDAYIAANYESTDGAGDISNWLITPEVTIVNGTQLTFWTRKSELFGEFADRLEVRMSVEGASTDVGETAESVGAFTTLLLTINPELEPGEYPQEWTSFTVTVRERSREPVTGRFAFRYWVTDSGPDGTNGDYIGIDTVGVTQGEPPPGGCDNPLDIPWLAAAPTSGTTAPGGSEPVTVSVDAADLEAGDYAAQLCVTTNDPAAPLVPVPVSLTVGAAAAQVEIYVGEYKFNDPILHVMGPGGADVQPLDIIPAADWLVVGLQVDDAADKIYWTHGSFNDGRIQRANLDGTGIEPVFTGLTNPRGLALDAAAGKLYWSDTQDRRIYRGNINGTGLEAIIDDGAQHGRPTLDLANGKVYYGNFDQMDIRRANLDGTGEEILFGGVWTGIAIALDHGAGKLYYADSNTSFVSNYIARANFDGSDLEILYEGQPTSSGFTGIGLDLAAGKLYWSDEITDVEKGVWEANLDGTGATRIYESPEGWNAGAMTLVTRTAP